MQAKELMLPRAANKNVIKVSVSNDDDQDDIRTKLDIAKKKSAIESTYDVSTKPKWQNTC